MDKIAELIIKGDDTEQAFQAVKLGFCKAMSEFGLSPKTAEGFLQGGVDISKELMMLGIASGAGLGVGSAMLRHKMEQTADESESPQMRATRAKVDTYKKMLANAQDQQIFNGNQQASDGAV